MKLKLELVAVVVLIERKEEKGQKKGNHVKENLFIRKRNQKEEEEKREKLAKNAKSIKLFYIRKYIK